MKSFYMLLISFICFFIGLLSFAISQQWIIFYWPNTTTNLPLPRHQSIKKTVVLSFWHRNSWHHEKVELLWPQETSEQIKNLVNAWLRVLNEEQIIKKNISLQSVLISDNGYAYLSFDRNPIIKSQATYYNLMLFESLLKTLQNADIHIKGVYFMAHHQPLNDAHLNFMHPWPLTGFTKH